jgi:pSer/pThr/pTyr-binding forkhead associated (FHA) protein
MTATLTIHYPDGRSEERSFSVGSYEVGRDVGDIVLRDANVSSLHARIDVEPGRVSVTDLGSTNGTFDSAGNRLGQPHVMHPNQPIRLGSSSIALARTRSSAGGTRVMQQIPSPMFATNPASPAALDQPAILPQPEPQSHGAQRIAREQLDDLGALAQAHGKQAAALAGSGLGRISAHMGRVALGAAIALWLAWFVLPSISFSVLVLEKSFTFWDLLGFDLTNTLTQNWEPSHGLGSLLGLAALAAPFAVPFMKDARGKYLYAAPLVFLGLVVLKLFWDFRGVLSLLDDGKGKNDFAGAVADGIAQAILNTVSLELGAPLLLICSLVLATRSLRGSPSTAGIDGARRTGTA